MAAYKISDVASTGFLLARSALFVLPWLLHLLIADILLSALLPLSVFLPDISYNASSLLAASVWHGVQTIFTRINGASIIISGADNIPSNESAIVIANHVEWTDFYMIQALAIRARMLGRCRWFAKQQLRWVPFLGWGLWAMGMPLVSRRWTEDRREMDRVFRGVVERGWPMWLISYSEATRCTPQRRLEAEAWCKAHDRRLGKHVLYPRSKGFVASVQKLRSAPHVKAVYDVTIAYAKDGKFFQQPPDFAQSLMVPGLDENWRFFVHVDRFPLEELPEHEEGLVQWLEDRWVEKGEKLEFLRQQLQEGKSWQSF